MAYRGVGDEEVKRSFFAARVTRRRTRPAAGAAQARGVQQAHEPLVADERARRYGRAGRPDVGVEQPARPRRARGEAAAYDRMNKPGEA
jgi:hypothetical protein